jgi:hypothetical protein
MQNNGLIIERLLITVLGSRVSLLDWVAIQYLIQSIRVFRQNLAVSLASTRIQ